MTINSIIYKISNKIFQYWKIIISLLFILILIYSLIPYPKPLFDPDYSTVVVDENGDILRVFLSDGEQFHFPPDDAFKIPEKLKTAVLYYEDQYFYYHPGVNPVSICRAIFQYIKEKQIVSGASTITMQLARLSHHKPRTGWQKIVEIGMAFKIELHYSKEEILRSYLNHAPYGGNIVGFQAASLKYFGKNPYQLSWSEAAVLAVLPNTPGLISPAKNPDLLKNKRDRLLKKLYENHIFDQETFKLAGTEPMPQEVSEFSFCAPHLCRQLEKTKGHQLIYTTINKTLQRHVEDMVEDYADHLHTFGIDNCAVIIAKTKTGEVKSYVGSQDFFDSKRKGQVDGVLAPRSSGSILKPFLYALSIDRGIILPNTLINDIPTYYGTFSPANYDNQFNGMLSAEQALIRSLNVPAVRLLNSYGLNSFYHFLKSAGLTTLFRAAEDYGLPLILGGAETKLLELAALYRGLANGGKFSPLRLTRENEQENSVSYISPGACYLTLNMLKNLKRPGAEYYWEQYQNQWPIAWKTGTSYGHRDAWALGVSPEWTIGVWIGNFNGESNRNIIGAGCAGPLLFDLFNFLPKDPGLTWFEKPETELMEVEICRETGFTAGESCSNKITVDAPLDMKPLKICPYHKNIFVTSDEKYRVCSLCWEPGKYKKVSRLLFSPDVVRYMEQRGKFIRSMPPHKPECSEYHNRSSLKILYPTENAKLWLPREFDGILQKVNLKAAHLQKTIRLFWYIDDKYLGFTDERHNRAVALTKGWHNLKVIDSDGNSDKRRFYINLIEDIR